MKRKTTAFVLILAVMASVGVFAGGQGEDRVDPGGPWDARTPEISKEKITVTGPLNFEDRYQPELEGGSKQYELLFPRCCLWDVDVNEGQSMTVEGYTVTGMPIEAEKEDEIHLIVTMARIGDKEYDLEVRTMGIGAGKRRKRPSADGVSPPDDAGPHTAVELRPMKSSVPGYRF